MPSYDFSSLSPTDFEDLARDLLQAELGLFLESFGAGRDGGIDLRHAAADKGALIVQCKRYGKKKHSQLKSVLRREELDKIKKLSPERYILFTSIEMTPANKDELLGLLSPYCRSTLDIYGLTDVNNLLGKHEEIERKHYKLWMSSTTVLDRLIHSDIYSYNEFMIRDIRERVARYVKNDSFDRAIELLDVEKYCIVSGEPGVGKTTLSEMVLLYYANQGYQPVIVNSADSLWKAYKDDVPQLFYFDDFLGHSQLVNVIDGADDKILKFFHRCKTAEKTKFLLSTREYLLNQAAASSEKLASTQNTLVKCTINIGDYTKKHRAQILYNHVFFSGLPSEYKKDFIDSKVYLSVIKHRNYNPRIIETITAPGFVKHIENGSYVETVLAYLDNPHTIWRHAFENQFSPKARVLIFVLSSFSRGVLSSDLSKAFGKAFAGFSKQYNWPMSGNDYIEALRELAGSPLKLARQPIGNGNFDDVVEFENHGIRDYVAGYLLGRSELVELLFECTFYYDQVQYLSGTVNYRRHPAYECVEGLSAGVLRKHCETFRNRTPSHVGVSLGDEGFMFSLDCSAGQLRRMLAMCEDRHPSKECDYYWDLINRMSEFSGMLMYDSYNLLCLYRELSKSSIAKKKVDVDSLQNFVLSRLKNNASDIKGYGWFFDMVTEVDGDLDKYVDDNDVECFMEVALDEANRCQDELPDPDDIEHLILVLEIIQGQTGYELDEQLEVLDYALHDAKNSIVYTEEAGLEEYKSSTMGDEDSEIVDTFSGLREFVE